MKLNRTDLLTIVVSTSILVITASVAYYFAFFLPSAKKAEYELEMQKFNLQKQEEESEEAEKTKKESYYLICAKEARTMATDLLKDKVEIAKNSNMQLPATWKEAAEKDMYLKDDYKTLYENCLGKYGLE